MYQIPIKSNNILLSDSDAFAMINPLQPVFLRVRDDKRAEECPLPDTFRSSM
jgi:hypothetical protein